MRIKVELITFIAAFQHNIISIGSFSARKLHRTSALSVYGYPVFLRPHFIAIRAHIVDAVVKMQLDYFASGLVHQYLLQKTYSCSSVRLN